jgi:hypothetical protein
MQNEIVRQGQLLGLKNYSKCILDVLIASDTPALMADDSLTVFTGGLSVVPVCVIPSRCIGKHRQTSEMVFDRSPVANRESSQEDHLLLSLFHGRKSQLLWLSRQGVTGITGRESNSLFGPLVSNCGPLLQRGNRLWGLLRCTQLQVATPRSRLTSQIALGFGRIRGIIER